MRDYDRYNYWQINTEELPSRGFMYPDNAKIKIRSMTVLEVKFLATLSPATASTVCNELLEKCTILENFDYDDLLLPDRMYLIFWIRLNSFTAKTGYTITIPKCSGCGQQIEENIPLETITFKYLDKPFNPVVSLPDSGISLNISIPRYRDAWISPQDEIEDTAMYIDVPMSFEDKVEFVTNMSAYDYAVIRSAITENYCGINEEYFVKCGNCDKQHPIRLVVNDNNLFTPVNIMEILEMMTRICKYTHMQITNDWPWIEVEIENEIVNRMIQEENERNNKELNNAKQRTSGISSTHMPSMPSLPH